MAAVMWVRVRSGLSETVCIPVYTHASISIVSMIVVMGFELIRGSARKNLSTSMHTHA